MKWSPGLRFLQPCLSGDLSAARKSAYLGFYAAVNFNRRTKTDVAHVAREETPSVRVAPSAVQERVNELKAGGALEWPRIKTSTRVVSIREFRKRYSKLREDQELENDDVVVQARVVGVRIASKKLVFLDLVQDGAPLQVVLSKARLPDRSLDELIKFYHLLRRGDILSVSGNPYISNRGELSIRAASIPIFLTPCLASLPRLLEDRETRVRNRHVDLLVNQEAADTLRIRSHLIQHLRDFFLKDGFLEVQTPLLTDKASGAIAKPFTTHATEFPEKELALRIAPEIWLKRLVIGGMDRVFEIGPAFRNEGLDATHNPEFTSCEFYKSFADLENLIDMTEKMVVGLAEMVQKLKEEGLTTLPDLDTSMFNVPFRRISFIQGIEEEMGAKLPDLTDSDAAEQLIALFEEHSLPLPSSETLPRLLDKLASIYIEPLCIRPTFIIHHPLCMSPLSKSFLCPHTKQQVSARAELFIDSKEIANMYEEENSPFAQRDKFLEQLKYRDEESGDMGVDESYCAALEWGLPPTGGWGAGVDRLVMFFAGRTRISDVLSFGSLRNVVNLGSGWKRMDDSGEGDGK